MVTALAIILLGAVLTFMPTPRVNVKWAKWHEAWISQGCRATYLAVVSLEGSPCEIQVQGRMSRGRFVWIDARRLDRPGLALVNVTQADRKRICQEATDCE